MVWLFLTSYEMPMPNCCYNLIYNLNYNIISKNISKFTLVLSSVSRKLSMLSIMLPGGTNTSLITQRNILYIKKKIGNIDY